jgi:hypothetical protein
MIDAAERATMQAAVRGALADATARADADGVLAELGWLDLLGEDPATAIDVVFGALGATHATSTALDDVLASALGEKPRADVAVLLPRFGGWDPPARIDGADVDAQGLATRRAARAGELRVVCGPASAPRLLTVPTAAVEESPADGVDPEAGLRKVRCRGLAADARPLEPAAWRSAAALGQRAVAHQIAGASRAMLEMARAHALERQQFGRPIARLQAVRHRLAEALVAVEAAEAALAAARDEPIPETAALAKALAGRAAHTAARHGQQVLAGIGFTTEHAFHRYLKRTMVLEGLFGSADEIVLDVGRRLLRERRVPTLIEL